MHVSCARASAALARTSALHPADFCSWWPPKDACCAILLLDCCTSRGAAVLHNRNSITHRSRYAAGQSRVNLKVAILSNVSISQVAGRTPREHTAMGAERCSVPAAYLATTG